MTNKENVIQLLITEYNKGSSNPIKLYKSDIGGLDIPEDEIIKILFTLHEDGLIIANPKSPHKDFSIFWEITITSKCLNYFHTLKQSRVTNRREWVRTYIPITLSTLSLIISAISLLLAFSNYRMGCN